MGFDSKKSISFLWESYVMEEIHLLPDAEMECRWRPAKRRLRPPANDNEYPA